MFQMMMMMMMMRRRRYTASVLVSVSASSALVTTLDVTIQFHSGQLMCVYRGSDRDIQRLLCVMLPLQLMSTIAVNNGCYQRHSQTSIEEEAKCSGQAPKAH